MINRLLCLAAALALSACTTTGLGSALDAAGASAPAPLSATSVDEKALIIANQTADVVATSVDALIAAKVIVPGSPRALTVKRALITLRDALAAASAARRAGNTTSYATALEQAQAAITAVRAAVAGT